MPRYLFITGKLAAPALRDTLEGMAQKPEHEIVVLPISVAALADVSYILKHLNNAGGCDKVMIPGLCGGDLRLIEDKLGVETVRGPKILKDIPGYFGTAGSLKGYGDYKTRILAEIVDAYQIGLDEILDRASYFKASGADIIDLGCPVDGTFPDLERVIKALKAKGYSISLDSFNEHDILKADSAGVDFVLSVNSSNLELARRLRCKVVVIPDFEGGLKSLERNIRQLEAWKASYIIDPVLNPIGFGFTESIECLISMRRKYPEAEMLMGLGNITELTDADTTGMTAVMAGIAAELGIQYVLTTEVISWARGAVREMDCARKLMHYACRNRVLPKHLNDGLLTIKDPPFAAFTEDELRAMQVDVRDRHFRIFADSDSIYVFNSHLFIKGKNTQEIFDLLSVEETSHAFYLGRELERASIALKLGKRYIQEEGLRWGYLSP
jgi:dihydropteroate synthase-like protein